MRIKVVPYAAEHEEAVRAFNVRLAAAGLDKNLYSTAFPASHVPALLPKRPGCDLYQEYFLAVDEESMVRGGYILKRQPFLVKGEPLELADYQLPISEGIADRRFANVGVSLYMDAIRRHPRLWGLGGGGYHIPNTRFLLKAGWRGDLVPFWFHVVRPYAFWQNIMVLRHSAARRLALDLLAYSGAGWLGVKAAQVLRRRQPVTASVACEVANDFGDWADGVWRESHGHYSLIAVRDRNILNILYPTDNPRFIRLRIARRGNVIGWALLLNTQMAGHKQFGDMRVGTLVDCLAAPSDATDVVACVRDYLEAAGVDLIVSNQCSRAWCDALRAGGFFQGPSNFPFLASPKLAPILQPLEEHFPTFHLNRGDGDGPINL